MRESGTPSPINAIYHEVEQSFEDAVFKAIQKVDIEVDREELIKALQYDRSQYEKGYADGLKDAEKTGKWIECEIVPDKESITEWQQAQCSVCGKWHTTPYLYSFDYYNFCPNCGARMVNNENL